MASLTMPADITATRASLVPAHTLIHPSGTGESCRAGGSAGAGDVEGEGEPDVDFQAGWVPGCCVSAQAAGGESCRFREREEQEGQ